MVRIHHFPLDEPVGVANLPERPWGRRAEGADSDTVYFCEYNRMPEAPKSEEEARSGIFAEVAQLIEHQPSKLRVASLSLVFRSKENCLCSSGVEHFLGKEEVAGSNPAIGSNLLED